MKGLPETVRLSRGTNLKNPRSRTYIVHLDSLRGDIYETTYLGSVTTVQCQDGIMWRILTPLEAAAADVEYDTRTDAVQALLEHVEASEGTL